MKDDSVKGYSQLNKEHLLLGLCKAFNIDHRVHHVAHGIDKEKIKGAIKQLKKERDESLAMPAAEHDHSKLKSSGARSTPEENPAKAML